MEFIFFILFVVFLILFIKKHNAYNIETAKHEKIEKELQATISADQATIRSLQAKASELGKYQPIVDIEAEIQRQLAQSHELIQANTQQADQITQDAKEVLKQAKVNAAELKTKADLALKAAHTQADNIIQQAKEQATQIAGEAYQALERQKEIQATITAMENTINGYGDKYLKPTSSLLDDLAENYSHVDAGRQLTTARNASKLLTETGKAATCDYVEPHRSKTAIAFVTDAFNGKVDSILSSVKAENIGKLEQQINDAYQLVNHLGQAFRSAKITPAYLSARLTELKLVATVVALRDQEREEQRQIKEQIREEEKARREYERAMKEAAKEEETIKKAMEKAEAQIAKATDEQRVTFEAQLAELQSKLVEAEAKNERALSMAQQTRAGHVYVISNIGSFGETVFKIGMTRRLEPMDRVKELGDASVPFTFDVHAMMYSEDAPGLERELHRRFNMQRMNMVNFRKEFFRVDLQQIRNSINELIGSELLKEEPHFTLTAEAHEFRESQAISAMSQEERHAHLARLLKLEMLTPLEELSEEVE
ncbi:DUF4041 domain-containing protein [Chitinibacter sp. S2-10]|uniref:DUF4041 domain-containing protein n=1 Tax=Chitinibacter sp. S2-10 TaxID=3373597 RepID=UPI0039775953